jgi:putative FmdB family regulatory protein
MEDSMPKYDYKCNNCSSEIEITRSFDEDIEPMCTGCNSTMSRVWQATPAVFRGGGWGGS